MAPSPSIAELFTAGERRFARLHLCGIDQEKEKY
jgi:hypothetical protein